jgi:hypothetical protein
LLISLITVNRYDAKHCERRTCFQGSKTNGKH